MYSISQRKKLDPKGINCVHLGISNESIGREAEEESGLHDPVTYEEAAKFNNWNKGMDHENEAIENNIDT